MYFGSVRFFKNLILLCVIILILIPTVSSLRLKKELRLAQSEMESLQQSVDSLSADLAPSSPDELEQQFTDQPPAVDPTPVSAPADVETPAYRELYPDFYAPQDFCATERVENTVYLTFDDGPSARTDEILKTLAEKDVKATFFVVGQNDEANLQRMRDIVEQGHTIGMHTYSHDYEKIYASVEAYLEDMYQIFCQIKETTGVTPTVFRFPGGSINGYNGGL